MEFYQQEGQVQRAHSLDVKNIIGLLLFQKHVVLYVVLVRQFKRFHCKSLNLHVERFKVLDMRDWIYLLTIMYLKIFQSYFTWDQEHTRTSVHLTLRNLCQLFQRHLVLQEFLFPQKWIFIFLSEFIHEFMNEYLYFWTNSFMNLWIIILFLQE